ncbi:MAG: twin-arginine translocase TatA/TatE family subunit [Chloroflexi bacterium]|mgnify:FL=1|jgi:Sec-independent protein translocase protein TatA|nr:twin-arginine translocase TatA/TatE family subunit [Chloroflexota bacterium]
MEFLNLGWMEIALILILAFVVLGPNKMVKTGKDLGSWIRKLSKDQLFRDVIETTDEIRRYPRKIYDEARLELPAHVVQQQQQDDQPDDRVVKVDTDPNPEDHTNPPG